MRISSLVCVTVTVTSILMSFAEAQERPRPTIQDLMSADEFRQAGLHKVSEAELRVLNSWLSVAGQTSEVDPKSIVRQRGLARGDATAAAKNYRTMTSPRNIRLADGTTVSRGGMPTPLDSSSPVGPLSATQSGSLAGNSSIAIEQVLNGMLIAEDGQYLGTISANPVNVRSISNRVGQYGGPVGRFSIFNEVGRYGGAIGQYSPFNEISMRPPQIYVNGEPVCYLTVNADKLPRLSPLALTAWLEQQR